MFCPIRSCCYLQSNQTMLERFLSSAAHLSRIQQQFLVEKMEIIVTGFGKDVHLKIKIDLSLLSLISVGLGSC